jgi:hypothetical protein
MRLHARNLFAGVALQVFTVMVLVEAIFLAERFPMVFRDVLKNNADPFDTALIFLFTSTQIFDLALAIAILLAVYWTTLRMRENRELLVLFGAGTGPYQLIALTLVIAITAQAASLTVSGVRSCSTPRFGPSRAGSTRDNSIISPIELRTHRRSPRRAATLQVPARASSSSFMNR